MANEVVEVSEGHRRDPLWVTTTFAVVPEPSLVFLGGGQRKTDTVERTPGLLKYSCQTLSTRTEAHLSTVRKSSSLVQAGRPPGV